MGARTFFDDAAKKDNSGLKAGFRADRYAMGEEEYNWAVKNNLRVNKTAAQIYVYSKPIDFPVALARIETHLSHKRAVEELRESEERYALAVRGANDGLWDWNLGTNEVYWSPRWKAMLGYDESAIGVSPDEWLTRVHHDDAGRVKDALAAHLADESGFYESEHRLLHRDGTFRWVLCRGAAVRDSHGAVTRLAGSLTDITDAKVADALTGLPNRLMFVDLIERAIRRTERRRTTRSRSSPSGSTASRP